MAKLSQALTLHASFDNGLDADFSRGDKSCYVQKGKELVPAKLNDEVKLAADAGRFGGALHFPKKGPHARHTRTAACSVITPKAGAAPYPSGCD